MGDLDQDIMMQVNEQIRKRELKLGKGELSKEERHKVIEEVISKEASSKFGMTPENSKKVI